MINRIFIKIAAMFLPGDKFARLCGVTVGGGCRIYTKDFGSEPFLIEIGSRVTVSSGVKFINHDGAHWLAKDQKGRRYEYRQIRIGDECFIGAGAILLPGVRIYDRVIVGAGAVITKSVPENSVVAGNPARIVGSFEDYVTRSLDHATPEQDLDATLAYRRRISSVAKEGYRVAMKQFQ